MSWCEAFTVFSLILTKTFPHRWKDLMAYNLLILRTYREFGGRVWLSNDRAFREHTAASKITDKSSLNVQLYNFHAAGVSSRPHPSSQNSISSEATGSLSSNVVCRSWYCGTCSSAYSSCMFLNFDLLLFTLLNKHVILLHYYDVSDRLFAIHRLVNVRYKL